MDLRITLRSFALAAVSASGFGWPAQAYFQLCNRMSYVVETAVGVDDGGVISTRGWFRIDPGQCRLLIQGQAPLEQLYVHARALPVYGASPLPQAGNADLCVGADTFAISDARNCRGAGQRLVRFSAVKPSENDKGVLTAYLAEEAEYADDQARDAAIQRLLTIAGYDATPIDGIRGAKTDAALALFLQDNKLGVTAAGRSDFFDILIAAAQKPEGTGFAWCNDTNHTIMAALGIEDRGIITTRGWYRVEPGKCVRPEIKAHLRRLYSYAEAIGDDGLPLRRGDKPFAWGGETILCTRDVKFELIDHKDCADRGLVATGFANIDLAGRAGTTVRLK